MPAKAIVLYLLEKYKYETQLNCYHMDILKAIADPQYEKPLPRYADLIKQEKEDRGANLKDDYNVNDVIEMFRGTGKLAKGG